MAYLVVGILICKGEELYMTSITIKMNDCLSLSLFFQPSRNNLTFSLSLSINTPLHRQVHASPAGPPRTYARTFMCWREHNEPELPANKLLLPDKPEESHFISSHFQEFKSYFTAFAVALTTSWLVLCQISHKQIILKTPTASFTFWTYFAWITFVSKAGSSAAFARSIHHSPPLFTVTVSFYVSITDRKSFSDFEQNAYT